MSHKSEKTRILHMRDAARKAIDFSKGMDRESLDSDEKLALSLIRLIEIVGEAAKSIQDSLKMKYPHIPWKLIAVSGRLNSSFMVLS